jgi:hypothetical protein
MNVYDVFTPTRVPTVTYVDRQDQNLEQQLRSAIRTPGLIASLSGPSKSGKTVLVNKVIAADDLISVSGAAIRNAEMLWDRVLNWMEAPSTTSTTSGHTTGVEATGKASGTANLLLASGKVEGSLGTSYENERSKETIVTRAGIDQVIREIANSNFVLFIDDFHYMPKDTQSDVARQMKEAAEKGVCICTASVPHRADDVVRGNPELRGRVKAIDFAYWKPAETVEIGVRGFKALGADIDRQVIDHLSRESFGSPQLMQQICLQMCFYLQIEEPFGHPREFHVDESDLRKIFAQAATTAEFSSLVDALHAGPKHRGTPRSEYALADLSRGDVYRCILLALLQDPPRLSFTYDDIYQRTRQVCVGASPSGSSVAQALTQIHDIAAAIQPETPVIEWSDDFLDIADPYFLYYIRHSPRLDTLQKRVPF